MIDTKNVDNIIFNGIDYSDYPEFSDAFIVSADYCGEPMTEEQLEELAEYYDFVYNSLMTFLY